MLFHFFLIMISAKSFFVFLAWFLLALGLFFSDIEEISSTFSSRWWTSGVSWVLSWQNHNEKADLEAYAKKETYLYGVLEQRYYDSEKINLVEMQENALKWFVEALGDPHTEYLTKEENEVFDESMEGTQHFEWIGAVVTKKKDGIMISEVLKWSPAFVAWLQTLDIIIQIDGESTQDVSLGDAVKKIRWPKDSIVTLWIFRQRDEWDEIEVFDVEVTRGTIDVPSVTIWLLGYTGWNAAHIEVAIFGDDTIAKLQQALLQLTWSYESVILDLRGNGGGYLPTAVELASFFLPKNEIVTTAKYTILPDEVLRSKWYGAFLELPTVVLIDGMSASASEIVAWALQQRSKVSVIGTKSFGKWSIQTIQPMDDGSMLKYTIGKWYLPNNETIDTVGLSPDFEIEFDRELFLSGGVDTQLQKAVELLADPAQWIGDQPCCGINL